MRLAQTCVSYKRRPTPCVDSRSDLSRPHTLNLNSCADWLAASRAVVCALITPPLRMSSAPTKRSPSRARRDVAMDIASTPMMDICDLIDRAVSRDMVLSSTLNALKKNFMRLSADPASRGDVITPLVPPEYRGPDKNAWVCQQADAIVGDVMQDILDRMHARQGGAIHEVFRGYTTVNKDNLGRRDEALQLCVMRRQVDGRSMFRRVLYNAVLYHVDNRDGVNVDIVMCYPDVDNPDANDAVGSKHYAYSKKMLIGATNRHFGNEDGDRNGTTEATRAGTVREVRGCLVQDSVSILEAFVSYPIAADDATLPVFADQLREMVMDETFEWNSRLAPDRVGSVISGPGAWRLLLPRQTTREKIDVLKLKHGFC